MKPVQAPAPAVPRAPALTAEEEAAFQAWSLDGYHLVNAHCRDEEITGTYCRQKLQFSHPSVTQGMELDEAAETLHRADDEWVQEASWCKWPREDLLHAVANVKPRRDTDRLAIFQQELPAERQDVPFCTATLPPW